MHRKKEEMLSEEELMMVSGGTGRTPESDVPACPKCGGKRTQNGNKIVCNGCSYTVLLKKCPHCNCQREVEEISGGRYKCLSPTCGKLF